MLSVIRRNKLESQGVDFVIKVIFMQMDMELFAISSKNGMIKWIKLQIFV